MPRLAIPATHIKNASTLAGGWTERQAIMENVAATATALDICPWPMIQEQSRPEAHDKRCLPTIARGRAASLAGSAISALRKASLS